VSDLLTISRLGARGDGVADREDGPVFVPKTLPGEVVRVEHEGGRAHLVAVDTASPERVEPFCPYFSACGGCAAQHMSPAVYGSWKHGIVTAALAQARIDAEVAELVDAHGAGRRRITLHARSIEGAVQVGYMAPRTHDLVAIDHCPIAEPELQAAAPRIALALARRLARSGKPLDVQVTATETGFDADVRGHGPANERLRGALIAEADALDLARLSLHGEILVERRAPVIPMGRARVSPPPGGFLQATRAGEEALAALVVEACAGVKRVADLFAGCGPFALRLAEFAQVHAAEMEAASLASLDRAVRGTGGALRQVTTEPRDLFRRPLLALELDRFDAVVLDPPRAGAEAQARQIAESKLPLVAYVSCDPGSFARDAGILIGAGFGLERVTPVDQFKYSAHVELVGVFRREKVKKRRR
jgi:23S rRNA (uracil1939-C5)-methyltransferase